MRRMREAAPAGDAPLYQRKRKYRLEPVSAVIVSEQPAVHATVCGVARSPDVAPDSSRNAVTTRPLGGRKRKTMSRVVAGPTIVLIVSESGRVTAAAAAS